MRPMVLGAVLIVGCTAHNPGYSGSASPDLATSSPRDLAQAPDLAAPPCRPDQVDRDPRHCGGCDNDCALLPNVDAARVGCANGLCVVGGACLAGFADCTQAPGCESDLHSAATCGSCANSCTAAAPVCAAGAGGVFACTDHCAAPLPDLCGTICVDEQSDPAHCGSCSACPSPPNGVATCQLGQCGVACSNGFHVCSTECVANSSILSCGGSCVPCAPPASSTATCDGASCGFVCDDGFMPSGGGCVAASNPCATVSCAPGQGCLNGVCCGTSNAMCSTGADCCNGVCSNFVIFNLCGCNDIGVGCTGDAQCCSSSCVGGVCACLALGAGCGSAADCCSGNCDSGTNQCACAAVGATCGGAGDCCSGVCSGTCQCKTSGSCTGDNDCCNGECVGGFCRQCTLKGTSCGSAATCCSGVCNITCQCAPVTNACQRDAECCSGSCVSGKCACVDPGLGTTCAKKSDCCSGACTGGSCACVGASGVCGSTKDCCDGFQCDGTKHCVACGTSGVSCGIGTPCCTDRNFTCVAGSGGFFCCGGVGAGCPLFSGCCTGLSCSTTSFTCTN